MKLRVYIDTSVLGGCDDLEFQEFSRQLMEHFVEGHFILVLSDLTVQELAAAPKQIRARLMEVPEEHIEALQLDSEAMDLADACIYFRGRDQREVAGRRAAYRDCHCRPRRCARELEFQAHCKFASNPRIQLRKPPPRVSHDRDPGSARGVAR